MEWTDVGIVIGSRRLGEIDALVELMTAEHGRHLGVVKAGRTRRAVAGLQIGNRVRAVWRARLDEHVGTWAVEPLDARAALLMDDALGLNAVQTLAAHLRLLPEREPHPDLWAALGDVLDHLADPSRAGEAVVRFELMVIEALGFGLDLSCCALTGETTDLAWVSPRTGRAATRTAGAPHADRLLVLPAFLAPDAEARGAVRPGLADVLAGFRLSGHFLARHVWDARGITPPTTREALIAALVAAASRA